VLLLHLKNQRIKTKLFNS